MKFFFTGNRTAFSLVEVVVAVGIFALAIVGVIGLLSPTNKAISDVSDSDMASRAVGAIQAGLQQLAQTPPNGFTDITSKFSASATSPTYSFYVSKNGDKIGTSATTQSDFPNSERFFEFALIRNGDSPAVGNGLSPAANDATAGFLAFTISLRWPAYLPNGTQFTANEQKSVLVVPAAVTR
jgi:type II secretory pathway pseudopilin PulG